MKNSPNNLVIYQVYVRNFSEEGSFSQVTKELERITSLGVDVLYLMPFHKIGKINRKGKMGSPYAISDYRSVSDEYGTLDDLKELIEKSHELGLKVIMDIVFNHTAPDHDYVKNHPEWYYRKEDGSFGNKIGDWWDIQDLDTSNLELQEELIEILIYWQKQGIDGIRCDVANYLPIEFWKKARARLKKEDEEYLMLAESTDPEYMELLRDEGYFCTTDSKTFEAFDALYDYDLYGTFKQVIKKERPLSDYVTLLENQHSRFNRDDYKLRFIENHDQERIFNYTSEYGATAALGLMFFLKGWMFLYNGIEAKDSKLPNLFDKDVIDKNIDLEWVTLIKKLITMKHKIEYSEYKKFHVSIENNVVVVSYTFRNSSKKLLGYFDLLETKSIDIPKNAYDFLNDLPINQDEVLNKPFYIIEL